MTEPESSSGNKESASFVERFRDRLSYHDALPQMVVLGVLSGLAASLLIVAFRWLIESPLGIAFGDNVDNFESLSPLWRFLLPFLGALILGIGLRVLDDKHHSVSVSHVLDRLHNYQGKIPASNLIVQFFGGIVALVSGQSVGREGPGIHLGAGAASLLGQYLKLPHNSLRTLVACGAAAAIAASFNTPMAGVVFAMEVILMEYTITGFIPVILASVLGAAISQLVFGADLSFVAVHSQPSVVTELPYLVLSGIVFSVAAAGFIKLHLLCMQEQQRSIIGRFALVGLMTGAVAVFVPQVLGNGYDTLNLAMTDRIDVQLLIIILFAKLLVTAIATGLGMVGGVIGPVLMIGGCLGGVLGMLGGTLASGASDTGFYVSLGMVAMMGAVLNAPLAALVAILELSNSPGIIFPAMLIVVVACLGVQVGFSYRGIFAEQLKLKGHDLFAEPGKGFLSRLGVRSLMNKSFRLVDTEFDFATARRLVESSAIWLVVEQEENYRVLTMADLARYLQRDAEQQAADVHAENAVDAKEASVEPGPEQDVVNLDQIPAQQYDVALVDSLSSLHDASKQMRETGAEVLLVIESISYSESRVVGVLTRDTLTSYYGM